MKQVKHLFGREFYRYFFFFSFYLTSYLIPNNIYCQEQKGLDVSIATMAPLQHYMQIGYSFQENDLFDLEESSFFKIYLQTGIAPAPYIKLLLQHSVKHDDLARDYLKDNLRGKVGYGVGLQWSYKKWNINMSLNKVSYKIKDRSSRELVESLLSKDQYLLDDLNYIMDNSTYLKNLYNNYLISPVTNTGQLSITGGYKLYLDKRKSFSVGFDLGATLTLSTSVHIDSDRTDSFADELLNIITPVVKKELEDLINWKVVPTVGIRLIYNIPVGR